MDELITILDVYEIMPVDDWDKDDWEYHYGELIKELRAKIEHIEKHAGPCRGCPSL